MVWSPFHSSPFPAGCRRPGSRRQTPKPCGRPLFVSIGCCPAVPPPFFPFDSCPTRRLVACLPVCCLPAQHHPRKKKEIVLTTTTIDQPGPHPFQSPSPLIKERLLLPTRVELPNLCYTTLLFLTCLYILRSLLVPQRISRSQQQHSFFHFLLSLRSSELSFVRSGGTTGSTCDAGCAIEDLGFTAAASTSSPRIPDANTKPSR